MKQSVDVESSFLHYDPMLLVIT